MRFIFLKVSFNDHVEIKPVPDGLVEFLTGFFKVVGKSMSKELLEERKRDDQVDEKGFV